MEESKIEIKVKIIDHEDVCLIRVKPTPPVNGKCGVPEIEVRLNSKIIAHEDSTYIRVTPSTPKGECGVKIEIDLSKKTESTKA